MRANVKILFLLLLVACSNVPTETTLTSQWSRCAESRRIAHWETYRDCFQPGAVFEQPGGLVEHLTLDQAIAAEEQRTDVMTPVFVMEADSTILTVERGMRSVRADVVEFGKDGRIMKVFRYLDAAMLASPGATPLTYASVIATGTTAERANEAVVVRMLGDYPDMGAQLSDDAVWFEPWLARALGRSELGQHVAHLKEGVESLHFDHRSTWFGGDFVVATGDLGGEHFAAVPALGIAAPRQKWHSFSIPALVVVRLEGGRVKAVTWFWQTATMYEQLDSVPRTAPLEAPQ